MNAPRSSGVVVVVVVIVVVVVVIVVVVVVVVVVVKQRHEKTDSEMRVEMKHVSMQGSSTVMVDISLV